MLVALIQSGQALRHALGDITGHHLPALFAVLQLFAALLFLLPRTLRAGGVALFVVFAHAALYQLVNGQFPAAALVCAVAALFVTLHGDAWGAANGQRRAARG